MEKLHDQLKKKRLNKAAVLLILALLLSLGLKLAILRVGSPFITIDDNTAFEGGFMVWFGQAPPQRMYLESWVTGISCLSTYLFRLISHDNLHGIGVNFVANAYRDYYGHPDLYVHVYRFVMILIDMTTAWLVYLLALLLLRNRWKGWAATLAAVFYLFAYNTYWCDMVARPDTLTAFFAVVALFFYYRSDFGNNTNQFLCSCVAFGLAAGMKLHAALFAIFVALDLLRVHGLSRGLPKVLLLGGVSLFFFFFAAGSPFFDPLMYIKLRRANAIDDASPWIKWGEQFLPLFKGTGWLIIPGVLISPWAFRRDADKDEKIKSIIFLSICWLALFASIRQLRAYWMLPALPLFFITASYAFSAIGARQITYIVVGVVVLTMLGQSLSQVHCLRAVPFKELRTWIKNNAQGKPFFILGYEAIMLPKDTNCIRNRALGLRRIIESSVKEGLPFTIRHLKNWEERSRLLLYDMLNYQYEPGLEYYSYYSTPLEKYSGIISLNRMKFILLQKYFPISSEPRIRKLLREKFVYVTEVTGAGGGGGGLHYKIYKRKANAE